MSNSGPEYLIYRDLRRKILQGQIHDGERLVETALAASYQASRLHIKSALRLLEQEQLARHIPQCGFAARGLDEEAFGEIIELRIALERVVFARLAEKASQEQVAHLSKIVRRVAAFLSTDMLEDAMEEVDDFYSYAYEISGLNRITAILQTYGDYLKISRRRSASVAARNEASLRILQALVGALEKRDAAEVLRQVERRRDESD